MFNQFLLPFIAFLLVAANPAFAHQQKAAETTVLFNKNKNIVKKTIGENYTCWNFDFKSSHAVIALGLSQELDLIQNDIDNVWSSLTDEFQINKYFTRRLIKMHALAVLNGRNQIDVYNCLNNYINTLKVSDSEKIRISRLLWFNKKELKKLFLSMNFNIQFKGKNGYGISKEPYQLQENIYTLLKKSKKNNQHLNSEMRSYFRWK